MKKQVGEKRGIGAVKELQQGLRMEKEKGKNRSKQEYQNKKKENK